jgi:hypothetical protein
MQYMSRLSLLRNESLAPRTVDIHKRSGLWIQDGVRLTCIPPARAEIHRVGSESRR